MTRAESSAERAAEMCLFTTWLGNRVRVRGNQELNLKHS